METNLQNVMALAPSRASMTANRETEMLNPNQGASHNATKDGHYLNINKARESSFNNSVKDQQNKLEIPKGASLISLQHSEVSSMEPFARKKVKCWNSMIFTYIVRMFVGTAILASPA